MLWSLRNKLVLTYLLIGLAPVVLFVTLVSVMAYIAAGQFAIHLADTRLQAELSQIGVENEHRAERIIQGLEHMPARSSQPLPEMIAQTERADRTENGKPTAPRRRMAKSSNGTPIAARCCGPRQTPPGLPPGRQPPWRTLPGPIPEHSPVPVAAHQEN
jgi:sigma-B regulation protein RsbU (phosphoserine phosphatase)